MSASVPRSLAPALVGHAFQQTALVAMLPVLVERLALPAPAVGGVVGGGMLAAATMLPLLGARIGRRQTRTALCGMLVGTTALAAVILAPPTLPAALTLAVLAAIRLTQGISAATLLITAQATSLAEPDAPRRALGRTQSLGGAGRALSAALVGPTLAVWTAAPLIPAAFGAVVGLARLPRDGWRMQPGRPGAPAPGALAVPLIVNAGLGSAQVSLAPLLAARAGADAESAAGQAGLCLAAANLGVLAAQRWLAPHSGPAAARYAAAALACAAVAIPLAGHLAAIAALCALAGAAAGVALTANLIAALDRQAATRGAAAGWNATAMMGGLAVGVALGAALQPLWPGLPFLATAALAAPLALPFLRARTPT